MFSVYKFVFCKLYTINSPLAPIHNIFFRRPGTITNKKIIEMIENLRTISRTTEVAAAATRMIGAFKNNDWSADAYLSSTFATLEQETTRLTVAIKRSKAESELEMKDEIRDDRLRSLYYLLVAFLNHPDPEIRAAAEAVTATFEKYGLSIIRESYATESAMVNSLLMDLEDSDLVTASAKLPGCAEIVAALKKSQTDFEETRIAYEEGKGAESTKDSATVIKKSVVRLINDKLVVYLRAMNQVDVETYGSFYLTIAEVISDNNEVVKKRSKKNTSII